MARSACSLVFSSCAMATIVRVLHGRLDKSKGHRRLALDLRERLVPRRFGAPRLLGSRLRVLAQREGTRAYSSRASTSTTRRLVELP